MHNNKYINFKSTPLTIHNKTLSFLNVPWPEEQSVVPQKLQMR